VVPNVLIVDDDTDLLQGQRVFLEEHGYSVETATSMESGLEMLQKFTPDIILADLMMEHYDTGFVFCKRIKDIEELRDVPIIMQTSAPKQTGFTFDVSNPKTRKWIMVDEVITKPVPLDALLGKIERYLGKTNGKGDSKGT
jgi:CheY-like chemotaxis protein